MQIYIKRERMQIVRWSEFCTSFFIQMIESEIKFKKTFPFFKFDREK